MPFAWAGASDLAKLMNRRSAGLSLSGDHTALSLSPHRAAAVGIDGELIDEIDAAAGRHGREAEAESYVEAILENLRRAGVHQKDRDDRIAFTALKPWPGELICAEGRYPEGETERRAGIFIGPEYGTVQRADLVAAAREAAEAGFDLVIACAFNFDAHASEFHRLGRVPVLQARMNPDLHMADALKAGGGNLFPRPKSGRIAVKVINHLGDEVMKVFGVP